MAAPRRPRRRRARERRPRHQQRDHLPDRARVSVALRDVRPLAAHDRRRHARRRNSGADRRRPRRPPGAGRPAVAQVKLYNAGSFFDPRAVPPGDYEAIANAVRSFDHIVIESHPSLIGPRLERFLDALSPYRDGPPPLEVAMGLETAHPKALERLNKHMTVDGFKRAAGAILDARRRAARVRAHRAAVRRPRGAAALAEALRPHRDRERRDSGLVDPYARGQRRDRSTGSGRRLRGADAGR